MKAISLADLLKQQPTRVIEHSVKGMLPHTRLGRAMYKKLKVYADDKHRHQVQLLGTKVTDKGSSE
jgi:large subunit ribosomal protein L13